MSNLSDVAQAYFNSWNAQDSDAIANEFNENGEYSDPNIRIRGRDIGRYAHSLWEAARLLIEECIIL